MEHVFVYGTLKSTQCRGKQWPVPPVVRREGFVRGELYDLGPYPGLQRGNDLVVGEVWSFHPTDFPVVLRVLDEIEVTNQPGIENEYDRIQLLANTSDNQSLLAHTYLFVDLRQLTLDRRIHPWLNWQGQFVAAWPGPT